MSGLLLALGLVLSMASVSAQNCADTAACNYNPNYVPSDYQIIAEVVASDIGPLVGALGTVDLTGYTRPLCSRHQPQRLRHLPVSGTLDPTYINTRRISTTPLWAQEFPMASMTCFSVCIDLAYGSWVTIGIEGSGCRSGRGQRGTVQSSANVVHQLTRERQQRQRDHRRRHRRAWYVLNGDANGVPDARACSARAVHHHRRRLATFRCKFSGWGQRQLHRVQWAIGAGGNEEGCLYLATYYLDEDGDGYGTTAAEFYGPQELCGSWRRLQ